MRRVRPHHRCPTSWSGSRARGGDGLHYGQTASSKEWPSHPVRGGSEIRTGGVYSQRPTRGLPTDMNLRLENSGTSGGSGGGELSLMLARCRRRSRERGIRLVADLPRLDAGHGRWTRGQREPRVGGPPSKAYRRGLPGHTTFQPWGRLLPLTPDRNMGSANSLESSANHSDS